MKMRIATLLAAILAMFMWAIDKNVSMTIAMATMVIVIVLLLFGKGE